MKRASRIAIALLIGNLCGGWWCGESTRTPNTVTSHHGATDDESNKL